MPVGTLIILWIVFVAVGAFIGQYRGIGPLHGAIFALIFGPLGWALAWFSKASE